MTLTRIQHGIIGACGLVLAIGSAFTPLGPLLGPLGAKIAIGFGVAMAFATNLTKVIKGDDACAACAGTGVVIAQASPPAAK